MESTPLAPHVVKYYTIQWFMDDKGMINQTLEDMQDRSIELFIETAKSHNQAIYTQPVKEDSDEAL
jgi:hypothetical protein